MTARKLSRALLSLALLTLFLPHADSQEGKKLPIPNALQLKKAADLVAEIFRDDLKANDPAALVKLANQLLQQGRDSRDEAALRYELFRGAGQLAEQAGDFELALLAIEEMHRDFLIDGLTQKAAALSRALPGASLEQARSLAERALLLVNDAVESDHHEAALKLGTVAEAAALKAKNDLQISAARKRLEEVRTVQKSFGRLQSFIDRLKANPKDAEANRELGSYYALLKGRWERALPLLAMGNDANLKSLALRDLAEPKDAREQLSLADAWWDRAALEKEPAQLHLQRRALHWYEKCLTDVKGLSRTKALRRIDQVSVRLAGLTGDTGPVKVGELFKFDGHTEEVKSVAFSGDGRQAVSGGVDLSVRLWDLGTGKPGPVLKGHTKQVWGVGFHPTNRTVFSSSWDATVRQWDPAVGNEIRRFTHPKDVNSLAVSRDGTQIMTGCDDYQVHLWNTATGEKIRSIPGHTNFVYGVAFSPDMKHGASGGTDRGVRVFDLASGQLIKALEGSTYSVHNVAFSGDGRHVFSSGDDFVRQWDIAAGKELRRYEGHSGKVTGLAISPDGRRLLTGGDDKTVRLWDVTTGKELAKMTGHTDSVTCVNFSADGRRAISGSYDRTVRVWGLPDR